MEKAIMKILVGCEESQAVTKEFRALGHEAWSNDIQDCSGGHPEWHIKGCIFDALKMEAWDMLIAFPPCTYLSNAGARHLWAKGKLNKKRYKLGLQGKEFFLKLWNQPIKHICLENPTPSSVYNMPAYSQVIEPYQFGDPYKKRTLLWLKRLPCLISTKYVDNPIAITKKRSGSKERSKTFPGIARAMATQWSQPQWMEQLTLF